MKFLIIQSMGYISRIFTSFFLALFSFFLISPQLVLAGDSYSDIVSTISLGDACHWNIQCEKVDIDQYICHTEGEKITPNLGSVREFSVGKQIFYGTERNQKIFTDSIENHDYKIDYSSPIISRYPFVGIIKIQV